MKIIVVGVATVILACAVTVDAIDQASPEDVAVLVNGQPVFIWEVGLLLPQITNELRSQGVEPKGEMVIRRALGRAIDNRLLQQEAERRGLEADPERVQEKLDDLAADAGGRGALEAELIKSRITYEQLRSTAIQSDLIRTLVESESASDVGVTDAEIETFYNENPQLFSGPDRIHTRHILFRVGPDATPAEREAARGRAEAAGERALAGEDFAALARELSEGPNADKGGDLGFTARGQMVKDFDDAVWELEVGQISDVVESKLGYHVVLVEEKIPGRKVPIDEVRGSIEQMLIQQRTMETLAVLLTELKRTAVIVEPDDSAGASAP